MAVTLGVQPALAAGQGNLAGYWKLDETTAGSVAVDASGVGNDLTPSGNPQPSTIVPPGISFPDSRSLAFSGSNTLDKPTPTGLNYGTAPRSISVWIYPTAAPAGSAVPFAYGQCAYNGVSTNVGMEFGFFLDSAMHLHFWGCGSSYDFDTNHTVPLNAWSNVAITYDGSTVVVYLNGNQVSSQARTLVPQGSSTPQLEIGSASLMDQGPDYYTGNVDDARVYTRALSSTEVSGLANAGNTSAVWTGGSSTDWQNPANWDINAEPDAYTNVTIGGGAYQPVLTAATGMAGLTINSGSVLNLNGQNATMNDAGTFISNGTLVLQGGENLSGFSNNPASGTVEYNGSGTYGSLNAGSVYNGLVFDGTGSWTLSGPLTVNGNLNITHGTVSPGSNNVTVGGNWSNGGTYNAGNGSVILNGGAQSISGSTVFYNLTKTTNSTGALLLEAGRTQTVTNNLTLSGSAGHLLSLGSSSPGSQWSLNPTGSNSLDYLAVRDSNNLGPALLSPQNSVDNGDNLNWFQPYKPSALGPLGYTQGGYAGTSSPTLSFSLSNSDTSENVKYQIEVSGNSSFAGPVINYTSSSVPQGVQSFSVGQASGAGSYAAGYPGQTLPDGVYYWRVQMYDSRGNSSGFAVADNGAAALRVDATPPTVPGTPAVDSAASSTPTWTWTASTDSGSGLAAVPYVVEWSQDPTFSSGVSSLTSSVASFTQPAALGAGTWYFRVRAVDLVGNYSAYSRPGAVTIANPPARTAGQNHTAPTSAPPAPTSPTAPANPPAAAGSSNNLLLNDNSAFSSGKGDRLNLAQGQNVRLSIDGQVTTITVAKVGGDYVKLSLGTGVYARNVTLRTGETDQYDINGSGKPNISVKLVGTDNGIAELLFSSVGLASVRVSLAGRQQSDTGNILIYLAATFAALGAFWWLMSAKRRRKKQRGMGA